jgi:predicted acylesterase/phospholipase RssA
LQALDEVFARRRVEGGRTRSFGLRDFDLFVGLSAGSMLATLLSAGIPAEELVRVFLGTSDRYQPFRPWHFMWPNVAEEPRRLLACFEKEQEVFTNYLSGGTSELSGDPFTLRETLLKMVTVATRLLPTGLFDPTRLEEYLRATLERAGLPNSFDDLARATGKSLYLSATDLNRGRLLVFGHDEPYAGMPIASAAAASCAVPLWYRPLRVRNPLAGLAGEPPMLDLAEGGLVRTANVRVAVEKGAELVICYNPFTRIVYDRVGRSLYDHGVYALASQAVRILIGARLDLAKELVFASDDFNADVVFIEPAADDYAFFLMNPMSFWSRERAARHGYESVKAALAANHALLAPLFHTHGIELREPDRRTPAIPAAPVDVRESRGAIER